MSSANARPIRSGPGRRSHPGALGGGDVLGGGDRHQHLLQHRALHRGEREPALDLAVAVVGHREPARLGCLGFLLLEEVGLVLVGQVRVRRPRGGGGRGSAGSWRRARRPRRRGARSAWMSRSGSRSAGSSLTARRITCACSGRRSPAARASRTWSWVAEVVAERHASGARPTGSSWSGAPASSRSTVAPTSWPTWSSSACAATRDLQLDDLRLEPGQLHQRRRGLGSGHRPHRRVHHTVGNGAHLRGRRGHLVVGCGHRCHGSTQAGTTDSQRPETALSTGLQVTNRSRSPAPGRCRLSGVSTGLAASSTTGHTGKPGSDADPRPPYPA